jgi:hypothetical protein
MAGAASDNRPNAWLNTQVSGQPPVISSEATRTPVGVREPAVAIKLVMDRDERPTVTLRRPPTRTAVNGSLTLDRRGERRGRGIRLGRGLPRWPRLAARRPSHARRPLRFHADPRTIAQGAFPGPRRRQGPSGSPWAPAPRRPSAGGNKMRVLHVTESRSWSGGTVQLWNLCRALMARGHAAALFCPPEAELLRHAAGTPVDLTVCPLREDYDLVAARRLAETVRRFRPDVVHAHHPRAHAIALLAGLFAPIPRLVVSRRVSFKLKKWNPLQPTQVPLVAHPHLHRRVRGHPPRVDRGRGAGGQGGGSFTAGWTPRSSRRARRWKTCARRCGFPRACRWWATSPTTAGGRARPFSWRPPRRPLSPGPPPTSFWSAKTRTGKTPGGGCRSWGSPTG